jgi:hypothetical protein
MTFTRLLISSATASLLACSLAHAAPDVAPTPADAPKRVATPADAPKPIVVSAVTPAPARARAATATAANTVEALLARVGNTSEGW